MAKKKKRRIQAPSLSSLDKGIYYCLILCAFAASLFAYPVLVGNYRQSVFLDKRILAQNNLGMVFFMFLGLVTGGTLAIAFDRGRRKKQPIFGKANLKYGPPQWKPVYPIFSKIFWNTAMKDKKRFLGGIAVIAFMLVLLITASILGLQPRECLHDDGSVRVYNCFDKNTVSYDASDAAQVKIYTREYRKKGPDFWGIEIQFQMHNGEKYTFSHGAFQSRDAAVHGAIAGMEQLKSLFDPEIIVIEGQENLPMVVRDMNLDSRETQLLYSLFNAKEP